MSNKKCGKYEELFIKEDETELLEHIKICSECREEHENMQKVSNLVNEVSFTFKRKKRMQAKVMKIAAVFFLAFLTFFTIQLVNPDSYMNETVAYLTGEDYTYEQMGLPVDDYGFIMVDFGE
ncbi:MAG: hypothetical protein OSJ27_04105 [Candidatus Gastranaerophilales bacterium]|nr:hypothetical protein [Candidatus Gastranaerophilales bacterium]